MVGCRPLVESEPTDTPRFVASIARHEVVQDFKHSHASADVRDHLLWL